MAFGRPKRAREPSTEAELFEYAVKSLGSRMKSVRDLRRLMAARAQPGAAGEEAMDRVIAKLHAMQYLSDPRFAADFTRLRQENQSFGRRRVQQDLQQKGIDKGLVQETLNAAYEEVNEVALARQYVERKRIKPPTEAKGAARVMRRLIRAGFSTSTVYKVLRSLQVPGEALEGVEAEEFDEASEGE